MAQWEEAKASADAKRMAVAEMRKHVQAGRVGLDTIFRDPPELLKHLALVDVMALARTNPRDGVWRRNMGRLAVESRVNILMPLGEASSFSREWAARVSPAVSQVVARRRREVERKARVSADSLGVSA